MSPLTGGRSLWQQSKVDFIVKYWIKWRVCDNFAPCICLWSFKHRYVIGGLLCDHSESRLEVGRRAALPPLRRAQLGGPSSAPCQMAAGADIQMGNNSSEAQNDNFFRCVTFTVLCACRVLKTLSLVLAHCGRGAWQATSTCLYHVADSPPLRDPSLQLIQID